MLAFDKLYAVSDLHIGGVPGMRAFREANALAWLIQHIANDQPSARVALLLNGDVFDFLADDNAKPFAFDADRMVRSLAADAEFAPIFQALRGFIAVPTRTLIVNIGNHDIELALPSVQHAFVDVIGASTPPAVERVRFEATGRGWPCKVAGRSVLAVHGNASDSWNALDLRGLRAAVAGQLAGDVAPPEPKTNAGTTLVLGVMNEIKRLYPVVDLLKPEGAPLMAVLDAIDAPTSARGLLRALGRIRVQRGTAHDLLATGDREFEAGNGPAREIAEFLETIQPPRMTGEERLAIAEENLYRRRSPLSLVRDDRGQLGSVIEAGRLRLQNIAAWFAEKRGKPRLSSLREALARWLRDDETFDPRRPSAIDRRIIASASPGSEILIAGHTHLPRELIDDGIVYLNTGTWMRVLKLQGSPYLTTDAAFEVFYNAVLTGTLAALDALPLDPRSRPVAVIDAGTHRLMTVLPPPAPALVDLVTGATR